ncbi:FecR domain-containing protein [Roseiconus lacunae]|uniref:FecR domain-containing protein n=1 Tax=Roseiconus lacunae TaxID=2605694 RepID=UPI00308D0EA2|nr:FecR domain-containing protein [Stieleria sp. HD01]
MSPEERFAVLWTDYLEGELQESSLAELRELLADDEQRLRHAVDLYQTHRLLTLAAEHRPGRQREFVDRVMQRLPRTSERFVGDVMADVELLAAPKPTKTLPTQIDQAGQQRPPLRSAAVIMVTAAVMLLAIVSAAIYQQNRGLDVNDLSSEIAESQSPKRSRGDGVRFANLAHAKFFGELQPPVDSPLKPQRDYVLMKGLAEVRFPAGASAIIEGPAVFRVVSDDCLGMDIGKCSVHAPDGAEGFRIETPMMRVVDRGTRFTVNVAETSETEVHVVEGAADIYENEDSPVDQTINTNVDVTQKTQVRLTDGQAQRFAVTSSLASDSIPYDPNLYRRGLPDRVIAYEATSNDAGYADRLLRLTLQRDGMIETIDADQLIAARVTYFNASQGGGYLCGPRSFSGESDQAKLDAAGHETTHNRRAEWSSDDRLVTGVINPGGSKQPLKSDPVLLGDDTTPGMAIRFDEPIVNGIGDDLVIFDLQAFANPPDGDAFHLSPMKFRDGLRSYTVEMFDLTMESPGARDLADFFVHMYPSVVRSLEELESLPTEPRRQSIRFRGLVVGIDLTDLGYAPNETVQELFIQDALDDKHHVDPVLIGGLPPRR